MSVSKMVLGPSSEESQGFYLHYTGVPLDVGSLISVKILQCDDGVKLFGI